MNVESTRPSCSYPATASLCPFCIFRDVKSKPLCCTVLQNHRAPEGNGCLPLCHRVFTVARPKWSGGEFVWPLLWTWYMRRLVLCSNKEASTVIVWRQSVYSQRCIEKLKYYIRQSNASQRKDKETLSLKWESQWCNNRLNHNLQQTPSKSVCPSSHG